MVLDKSTSSPPSGRSMEASGVIVESFDIADDPDLSDVADEEVSRVNVALVNALPKMI